jgi:NAD(P)-dependent dehydrogenase (short-subunit alcohol dehydrogenase family)
MVREGATVFATTFTEPARVQLSENFEKYVTSILTDVTNEHEVIRTFDKVFHLHSRLDIVINTVGGTMEQKSFIDVSVREWKKIFNINLRSAFLCTREAIKRMQGNSYGRIINMSAMAGIQTHPGRIPYTIAKAGVSLLTELVAQEVKGTGITINAIAPSILLTPVNLEWGKSEDTSHWVKPEDIADLICYLCSPSAKGITGTTFRVSGGI